MWSEQMLYIAQEKGYIGVNEVIQFVLLQVPVSDEVISLPSYVTEDLCVFVNIVCNCIKILFLCNQSHPGNLALG